MTSSAVAFALLSLTFAGINDVVFKRYASADRSRGAYVFGIGVVWALLQLVYTFAQGQTIAFDPLSVAYALAAGLLVTVANLLLLEALTHIDASLGSTIYRLNTVGVVLLSMILLQESLGLYKALGVCAGIGAVLLLYHPGRAGPSRHDRFALFFALAIVASMLRAAYGVVSKIGLNEGASLPTLLIISALCWIVGGFIYALWREKRFRLTRKKLLYAGLSGVLVFLIVNFLLLAVRAGQASVVIPIANMSFIIALLLSVALGMETITRLKLLAICLAAGAIVLLGMSG